MRACTAIPCRIDRRVPSRDGNSAGGLGSLDFGLQRTLPDIDFPPPLPSLYLSSLHFGPRPLLSLSFSLTLNIAVLLALIAPRSLLSFRFVRPFLSLLFPSSDRSPLLILFLSRSERVLARAATNLAPPNKMCQGLARFAALHAHAQYYILLTILIN